MSGLVTNVNSVTLSQPNLPGQGEWVENVSPELLTGKTEQKMQLISPLEKVCIPVIILTMQFYVE